MHSSPRHVGRALILGSVLGLLSCSGDDLVSPANGSIEIRTTTKGPEPDPDGYAVSINNGAEVNLGANATHRVEDLGPGDHSVELRDVTANCTVAGENPRSVSLEAGSNATVDFNVTCGLTTGSMRVTTSTSGVSPDPDGYTITLNGSDRGALAVTGESRLEALAAGEHVVGLSGVAANCQVTGENPRSVTVAAGTEVTVAFALICAAPPAVTGTLRVTTSTSGQSPDPDGYAFSVDGGAGQPIGTTASTTVDAVATGDRVVALSGVASNCTVQGTNPRPVTVATGATAEVAFAVTCTSATGSLRITTATTGDSPDPDGYTAAVDAGTAQPIGVNGSVTVAGLNPGAHQVTLGGLASNCRVTGDNPRSATVTAGNTVELSFAITCSASTGSIEITTATTGGSQDTDGYTVAVDNGTAQPIGSNATVTISDVAAGPHQVTLAGVATNCTVAGENPRPVTVAAGAKSTVTFDVNCPAPQSLGRIAWVKGDVEPGPDDPPQDAEWDVYSMNADGSGQANLTNNPAVYSNPTWSPSRDKIAFNSSREGAFEVYVMDPDGRNQVALTNHPSDDFFQDWSPDGTKILFVSSRDGNAEIYVVGVDGSGLTRLTNSSGATSNGEPRWSPDGSKILFWRDFDFYVMNADGTSQINLTNNPQRRGSAAWSPNGTRIAFAQSQDETEESLLDIYVMHADGSNLRRLTANALDDDNPKWSPDGRKIAFQSTRAGSSQIFLMNADGSGQANLSKDPIAATKHTWSPDGTKISFVSFRDDNQEIYVMNSDGTGQVRLTNDQQFDSDPDWSR